MLRDLGVSRGHPSWVDSFTQQLAARGREVGVTFDFGVDVGNSLDSLRLLVWAGKRYSEKQEQLAELFGDTVADLVEGVSKLEKIKFKDKQELQIEK